MTHSSQQQPQLTLAWSTNICFSDISQDNPTNFALVKEQKSPAQTIQAELVTKKSDETA